MPTSHHYQLNEITDLIIRTNPRKMLDIGIGFGKYGFLAREYLELWNGSGEYNKWERQIDGIEAFEGYITPLQNMIYDHIYTGDALNVLPGIDQKYDLILLIDVLEHFGYEDGSRILRECRRISDNTLISVPRIVSKQEEIFGNPYETHKYQWTRKDLRTMGDVFFLANSRSTICFRGKEYGRIKKELRKLRVRRNLVKVLEFLQIKETIKYIIGYKREG